MANTVNKHLNIFVNGKQVENNIKSIRAAMAQLINEQAKMTVGSDEYVAHSEKIKQLKGIYEEHRKELKLTTDVIEKATDKSKGLLDKAAIVGIGKVSYEVVQQIKSSISEYVEAFATLDDALAAVRKTTGMTTGEVDQLKESLKNIDTRTATNELLKIAEQGGRLGIAKEDIESFTKAVDVANVALGDSFGGGAEEIATVLGKIRNAYKETNTGEIGDSFNRIGSVINELGATSAASEQNIAEFTRRVGAMPEVFKPTIQQAMALGAAFEENSVDAEVASRSYAILLKTASADIDKFAQSMGEPVEAMRELINTNPTEFALKFAASLKGLNATQTGEYLKNLGLNADGLSKALGALSNNTERVHEMFTIANKAYSDGTSLLNEYNVVNNNTSAQLEKAKNAVAVARAELGEKLAPVLITITNGTAGFMKVLGSVAKTLLNNKAIVLKYVIVLSAYTAAKNKAIIAAKAHIILEKAETVLHKTQAAFMAIATTATNLYALAKARLTKNTLAAAAAQKALRAAFASTPWGAIIVAVMAVVDVLRKFVNKQKEAKKEAEELKKKNKELKDSFKTELNQSIAETTSKVKSLVLAWGRLKTVAEKKKFIQDNKDKFDELGVSITTVNDAENILVKNTSAFIDAMTKRAKSTAYNNYGTKIYEQNIEPIEQTKMLLQLAESQYKSYNDTLSKYGNAPGLTTAIAKTKDKIQKYKKEIDKLEKEANQYFEKAVNLASEADNELSNLGANTQNGSTTSEAVGEAPDSKAENKWADFYKKLQSFRDKDRISRLQEWEQTKAQIEQQYNELIEEANTFGEKGKAEAAKLESEKGDAVIKAGQEYLKKYTDILKKFEEETQKLAAKTDLSPEQSQMATEILGSQQEWDDKIAELQTNIDTIGDMVQDMDFDDENYAYFANMLSEMIDAQCAAITQKGEATANIVEKYARDAKAFVQTETSDLTKSQMSEYDRQIAAIDERYDTEIKKVEETILAKQKLMAEGGDTEELQAQIDELKALIAQMESLRKQNKARVPKEDNDFIKGSSTLERFLNVIKMSPGEFKDHWKEALSTTADAMQEWADTAFNIYSSIAQIQSNKDAAELQNYTDMQDAKSDALQKQYDQGLISEKYYNAQKDKIQADKEKKEKEIQHKEFERNKKASIVEATINGVLAAVKSFSDLGFPWGLIPMALSLATTGVQIAAIASQVNPYAKGGWIKQKQLILAGEEGEEWVASNKLLKDKKSKHVIEALEAYRQGNGSALDNVLKVPVPSPKKLSQSANSISRTFADNKSQVVNNNYYTSENGSGALLKEIRQMNKYLSDPKNRQAYITRKQQLEFEQQENEIKKYARL